MERFILQSAAIIAILLNGIILTIGGVHLNSERVLALALIVYSVYCLAAKRTSNLDGPTIFYGLWLLALSFSALLTADPTGHLTGLLISGGPFFYFLLFRDASKQGRHFPLLLEASLWCISAGGILTYVVWFDTGHLSSFIDRGRLALTMMEPNILGSTIGIMLLMHFSHFQSSLRHFILYILSLITLTLTFSKTPYLGFIIGSVYFALKFGLHKRLVPQITMLVTSLFVAAASLVYSDQLSKFYYGMLDRPDAVRNRYYALKIGWERFLEKPVFGNGPLDFSFASQSILAAIGTDDRRNLWIWQMVVAILHDSGLVGGAFFLVFLITAWRKGNRSIRQVGPQYIGYLAAMLALIVDCQTTTLHLSAIFGVVLGLVCSRTTRLMDTDTPTQSSNYEMVIPYTSQSGRK